MRVRSRERDQEGVQRAVESTRYLIHAPAANGQVVHTAAVHHVAVERRSVVVADVERPVLVVLPHPGEQPGGVVYLDVFQAAAARVEGFAESERSARERGDA